MDLGPCPKNHSVKLKTEYEELLKKATEEKDEKQVHILNTFKANYEQVVRFFRSLIYPSSLLVLID